MAIPNVVVSAPSQLFTLPNSFAAIAGGSIYIGRVDTDPTVAANQIQVYVQNTDGSTTAVSQPISIGAGGYPEYNGQIAQFITAKSHSMAIYDSNGNLSGSYPQCGSSADLVNQLLDPSYGDSGIAVKQPFASAAIITQHAKNLDLVTPYDFGGIGDGTLHKLSEIYITLASAQTIYPFITSLEQSIDYAALQAWFNAIAIRGGSYAYAGGRGNFVVNDMPYLNKTTTDNLGNKVVDFSGTKIFSNYGNVIVNDTLFSTGWNFSGSAAYDSANSVIIFSGNYLTQSKAIRALTGLTIGKLYAVSVTIETYTSSQGNSFLSLRYGDANGNAVGLASITGDGGPGVWHGEFIATAASMTLIIQDDTYTSNTVICSILRVDVRQATYGIRFYQDGTDITHGSLIVNNLRLIANNAASFGGVRLDTINTGVFYNLSVDGFTDGPGVHLCNLVSWSENNSFYKLKGANDREVIRFSRPVRGSGKNSFSRTRIHDPVYAGCRYFLVTDHATALYDSEVESVSGNMTAVSRAIWSLNGDQTDSKFYGARVETDNLPITSGFIEYGINDLRRAWIGNLGTYGPASILANGSFNAGSMSQEKVYGIQDFRSNFQQFKRVVFNDDISENVNNNAQWWVSTLLNCVSGTYYGINAEGAVSAQHGIIELHIALRLADGSGFQGSTFSILMSKAQSAIVDANKSIIWSGGNVANNETISVVWGGNNVPSVCFTYTGSGTGGNRAISVSCRYFN